MTELRHWNKWSNKAKYAVGYKLGLERTCSKTYIKHMNPYARIGYLEGQLEAAEILAKLEEE